MKRTKSMRVAVIMLALTLITSSFVGGTFAKYVRSAEGTASARVAKFGVVIEGPGDLFKASYDTDDTTATLEGDYSVKSANGEDKVVAPGTKGTINLFAISGTPEVAVRINAKMNDIKSIYLKGEPKIIYTVNVEEWAEVYYILGMNGKIVEQIPESQEELEARYYQREADIASSWDDDGVNPIKRKEVSGDYYPIKWTLKKGDEAVVTDGTLGDVEKYIDENINGKEYDPNTNLADKIGGTYSLEWEWPFDVNNGENDELDTQLGDLMAEGKTSETGKYNLEEAFDFSITVTQID